MSIDSFSGEYRFLSNFWPVPTFAGLTVEHYFAAAKTADPEEAQKVLASKSPGEAKSRGRKVTMREDWNDVRVETMLGLLRMKFLYNEDLGLQLLATGDQELVEGNTWGDTFWGVDAESGLGENNLGKLLMQVREELLRAVMWETEDDETDESLEWDI
jgi:ribA/ribD-fused uncharacterized protein